MTKEKTQKFVVVKNHTLNHKIGDKIDLTEKQAKNLVGKVVLASEYSAGGEVKATAAEVKKLKAAEARITELEAEVEELKKQLETASKAG